MPGWKNPLASRHGKTGFLMLAAAIFCACSSSREPRVQAKIADPTPVVGTAPVELRPVAQQLTVSSELVPFQEIDVYAKEPGYVKQLNVDYGSHVQAGQVMAVLEVPELEAQLQQDQAAIQARNNEVMRMQNEVGRAKAQHDVLHVQYERLAGVAKTKSGLVAQQEVDDARSKDLAAESNLDAVRGALEAAQSEVAVAQAKLVHDRALYDYSKITAPFEGVVTRRFANLGALMQAGTSSVQATPLVRLSQESLYRLVIPVPESYVGYLRIDDAVEVSIPALNLSVTGKVARTAVDVNSETRTMHAEVDVPNRNGKLVPGLYAEANLTLNQTGRVPTVPIQAVDREGDEASVMILENGSTVARRPVKLGLQTANYAEVLSGLTEGEQIVVSDRGSLKVGQHVSARPMEALAYDSSRDKAR
jgi:RND family efflux transporter MFP subunit